MTDTSVELLFAGTDGPVRFDGADMANHFMEIVHSWPISHAQATNSPFADVGRDGNQWVLDVYRAEPRRKRHNPVNCICDLIVELNWSRLRANTELMCLHAAGIEMGDSLVVLPSGRRSGKSTLTAELARRGHRVFSDDVIAVELDDEGVPLGLSTGISPRLRLPLPAEASPVFRDWVSDDPGPENQQYKYMTKAPVASYGMARSIGAIVTLDRREEDVEPAIYCMDPAEVLPVLIHQNFGRFSHSGRTLAAFEAIVRDLPCLRLTYREFGRAADVLEAWVTTEGLGLRARTETGLQVIPELNQAVPSFDATRPYCQADGFRSVKIGEEAFVADAQGVGIFRLGEGMQPIWLLLQEPITAAEIVEVLNMIFLDVHKEALKRDVEKAMRQLNSARLIEVVDC